MNFKSDNESAVNDKIMQAMADVNNGFEDSYGYDPYTVALQEQMKILFGCWCEVIPLTSGTAANALSTALMTPPYGSMYCTDIAHVNCDECGAPEFFSAGAKLITIKNENGKLSAHKLDTALSMAGVHGEHECLSSSISITQCTEAGTVYTVDEIAEINKVKQKYDLYLHMDGSRFANALATLGCDVAEITWKSGVDLLSFGATKNGAMMAEALIIFNPALLKDIKRMRKRAGHLISKMRYISAQLLTYLKDDLWLNLARHANQQAARVYESLSDDCEFIYPVQANEAFIRISETKIENLKKQGFGFHVWPGSTDIIRLVFSHSTRPEHVSALIDALKN